MSKEVLIIGAGPAGLTAAYLLGMHGIKCTVLEKDRQYVGGISRTVTYKGFLFDIGGHRFFSKSKEVEDLWTSLLPNDFLERPRLSRIFYRKNFYSYPIKPLEVLLKLGIIESSLCVLSYAKAKIFSIENPRSFEDWVVNQFGRRLFNIFFKTYTEKVWGMSCSEISADWAAQRIKKLSMATLILNSLNPRLTGKSRETTIKTLIDKFRYPRKGPGMLWEACADRIAEMGGTVVMDVDVKELRFVVDTRKWHVVCKDPHKAEFTADHVISTAPIRELVTMIIEPKLSDKTIQAGHSLMYRDFLIVALITPDKVSLPDNWIYIHDPTVKVGRIQNFKAWSKEMVPDQSLCCYGMEYFCTQGDDLWEQSDESLIELAKKEIDQVGLVRAVDVIDGCVVRQEKAYPVYDFNYSTYVDIVRKDLEDKFLTLHMVGRNGMHKYNNQDHAMMTAMLTVKNILAGKRLYDVWSVNSDAEYLEQGMDDESTLQTGLRSVPSKIVS
ncbi:MAG: NAD(P)/FAD-dependent oxidoreductase [SAR324 cluster bacterium]|nr:NAD(P)/FAD-dependent oxidoreductase [SAR324 cluster bacterium]